MDNLYCFLSDHIDLIISNFSGTLSYIFNNFAGARAFSEVVKAAKEAGYTEPDPRDDLSGTDVARKVVCLDLMILLCCIFLVQ